MFVLSLPQGVDYLPTDQLYFISSGFPQRIQSTDTMTDCVTDWKYNWTEKTEKWFCTFLMSVVQRQTACAWAISDLFKWFAWKCLELVTFQAVIAFLLSFQLLSFATLRLQGSFTRHYKPYPLHYMRFSAALVSYVIYFVMHIEVSIPSIGLIRHQNILLQWWNTCQTWT